MNYEPVTTMEQLDAMDDDLILTGYRAGLGFIAVNYMEKDPAYWHGYRNGQVDRGLEPASPQQSQLARAFIDSGRGREMFADLLGSKH